ncbi:PhoH family protein, partial [Thermus scotoductus]|uniref:PhoH family protein n=1 Tax=Thermus scotoductus TaxID=37636 RepID=UPI0020A3C2A2
MKGVREGELRERLLRPLLRELKDGARDQVVVGGLENLIQNLAKPFPRLQSLFQGYGGKTPEERKEILLEAIRFLKGIEGIAFVYFKESDVVRHPLVARIIKAYEEAE